MAASKDSMNQTSTLLELADTLYQARNGTSKTLDDIATLAKQRVEIASLSDYYGTQLNMMNPAIFQFLSESQKVQVEKQLVFTLYLFAAQSQLDEAEARTKNLQASLDGINLCLKRLSELKRLEIRPVDKKEAQLQEEVYNSEKYLKLLGLTILAPWLTSKMLEFISNGEVAIKGSEGMTETIKTGNVAVKESELTGFADGKKTTLMVEWMSAVNGRRLYWVWGGGMLAAALELLAFHEALPADQIGQAQRNLSTPSPVTGYMSWILYYTRFGINLGLLLKHTINGPWMEPKEANIPAWERFKTQWEQRKFALLNDSIWATANMVCFFWLRGGGAFGYAGNVLTALLLLMDLSLSIWALVEESTKHNKEMEAFNKKKLELKQQIDELNGLILGSQHAIEALKSEMTDFDNNEKAKQLRQQIANYVKQKEQLEEELKHFNKIIKQSELTWKYKKYGLVNGIAYAAGLLFAFCLVCCFFFPPAALAPALILTIGVAGAALCFTLTLLFAAVSGGLEITKTKESIKERHAECKELLALFATTGDENIKKQLYIEMKSLMAESKYQEEMIKFQAIKLTRSIFIDAFIPAIVFASLVFMPLGIGLGVMAAGLAVAVISHVIISRFEPQKEGINDLKEFDAVKFDKEFKAFATKFDSSFSKDDNSALEVSDNQLVALFADSKEKMSEKERSSCFGGLFSSGNGYRQLEDGDDMPPPVNAAT